MLNSSQCSSSSFLAKYACSIDHVVGEEGDDGLFVNHEPKRKEDHSDDHESWLIKSSPATVDTSIETLYSSDMSTDEGKSCSGSEVLEMDHFQKMSSTSFVTTKEGDSLGSKENQEDTVNEDKKVEENIERKSTGDSRVEEAALYEEVANNRTLAEHPEDDSEDESGSDGLIDEVRSFIDKMDIPSSEKERENNDKNFQSEMAPSVRAGLRLYEQALARFERLDAIANSRPSTKICTNHCKGNRKSSYDSTESPRFLKLYQLGLERQYQKIPKKFTETKNKSTKMHRSSAAKSGNTSSKAPFDENKRCTRLYNLSFQQQQEGRKRRADIEKAKAEHKHYNKKISTKEAERIYYEGIKYLLELDSRRIKAAEHLETDHKPFLFKKELRERCSIQSM